VGSYPTISPLPRQVEAVSFLLHYLSPFDAFPLGSTVPVGVRTFLTPIARGAITRRPWNYLPILFATDLAVNGTRRLEEALIDNDTATVFVYHNLVAATHFKLHLWRQHETQA
jgi:hypothetical protein